MLCVVSWNIDLFEQVTNRPGDAYLLNCWVSLFWSSNFELPFNVISRLNFRHVEVLSELYLVIAVKHLGELTDRFIQSGLVLLLRWRVNIFFSLTSLAFFILDFDDGIPLAFGYFNWGYLLGWLVKLLGVLDDFSQVVFRFRLFHLIWVLVLQHLFCGNYFILITFPRWLLWAWKTFKNSAFLRSWPLNLSFFLAASLVLRAEQLIYDLLWRCIFVKQTINKFLCTLLIFVPNNNVLDLLQADFFGCYCLGLVPKGEVYATISRE